ncbi:maintenance of telomere capping protein 1 [Lipomyces japonicus]|uniref:maintenance of telomere capping protein 1 n=1 Tax=Lipomyces japonicus TaxID=56871 RepID=UPI0034CD6542
MSSPDKSQDEDVLEFLESLGTATAANDVSTSDNTTATESTEKDLLGFLDELAQESARNSKELNANEARDIAKNGAGQLDPTPEILPTGNGTEQENRAIKTPESPRKDAVSSFTSWLGSGGLWDSASAAVKGAEAKVRELQIQDAKSLEKTVKGNLDTINKFGLSRTLASTLSSVLSTIAPPILHHEQLKIHIFHDIVGYPSIDTIVYSVFDRVMQQVEGGELIIVQKGRESRRKDSDRKGVKRDMGLFQGGLEAGEKLAKANIGQISKAKGKEPERAEESPVRKSDIYLSIQAVTFTPSTTLTAGDSNPGEELFTFIIYLNDPEHDLSFTTHSQSFPIKWCEWLDSDEPIPGQVDPREWLAEWVEEGLGLAVGVVAQRYVASRMALGVDVESL